MKYIKKKERDVALWYDTVKGYLQSTQRSVKRPSHPICYNHHYHKFSPVTAHACAFALKSFCHLL